MSSRHFDSMDRITGPELEQVCDETHRVEERWKHGDPPPDRFLEGSGVGIYLEHPSLRTDVSLQQAARSLGGNVIDLSNNRILAYSDGTPRETPQDVMMTMAALHLRILNARVKNHRTIMQLVEAADPNETVVINSLSNASHPTQVVGDLSLIHRQLGQLDGQKVVFVGDGNNVALSLAQGVTKTGGRFVHTGPDDQKYKFSPDQWEQLREEARKSGGSAEFIEDPNEAVDGDTAVIYTDVWTSMGQEAERPERERAFHGYQVNGELMARAPDAGFMHCLPAKPSRQEVTQAVLHGQQSWVREQVAHRLYSLEPLWRLLIDGEVASTSRRRPRLGFHLGLPRGKQD